jgi:pimeloyl-ACP methyl ester carboxylesterase
VTPVVDFIEAGRGPPVVLVHSSMAGARQWNALMRALSDRFHVRAVNLFGYGGTPAWEPPQPPSLDDYADLVLEAVPESTEAVALVGHSFGGAVAMQAARRLGPRADKLVLLEPSVFYLLQLHGRSDAYAEVADLSARMRRHALAAAPDQAAEAFITYWAGPGVWRTSPPERKAAFVRALEPALHEWNAVLSGEVTREEWIAALPRRTLLVCSEGTARPSRDIVALFAQAAAGWEQAGVTEGGHIAPLSHPHLVNPIIAAFLDRP